MRKILFLLPICCLSIFAFGQRDTTIVYNKGDFKILEGRSYYKNGQLKKQIFESEGDISAKYITLEDLFTRGIKPYEEVTLYARKLDSIIIYHNDGRINEKWIDSKRHRFIYDQNKQLVSVQEIYISGYKYKATTEFEPNRLITKTDSDRFSYSNNITIKSRINKNLKIPFELISFIEELVAFEIISKDNIQFQNGQNVVNYGDTLRLDLECNAAKSRNKYDFILRGTTADTTYNLNITLNIDGYHLTKSDFENGITYELTTNNLVIYFDNGGGKILKIYKNGVLEVEGSVPQIMNEISFKGYAKGEYTLELLDLTTRRKDKMTLILK